MSSRGSADQPPVALFLLPAICTPSPPPVLHVGLGGDFALQQVLISENNNGKKKEKKCIMGEGKKKRNESLSVAGISEVSWRFVKKRGTQ